MKKVAQPKTNNLTKNAQNLNASFKGFCTKYSVENYDINGDDISSIHKMNMKKTSIPISRYALDIAAGLEELCKTYEA